MVIIGRRKSKSTFAANKTISFIWFGYGSNYDENDEDVENEDYDDHRCSLKICCPVDLNETPRWIRGEAGERAAVASWQCVDHRHHCNDDYDDDGWDFEIYQKGGQCKGRGAALSVAPKFWKKSKSLLLLSSSSLGQSRHGLEWIVGP